MEYTNSQMRELIGEHIHSKRDRDVLEMIYIEGYTQETVAEKIDMSVRQIQNIIYKHQNTIFMHL